MPASGEWLNDPYLKDLNLLFPEEQQPQEERDRVNAEDLALFTNTHFHDFEPLDPSPAQGLYRPLDASNERQASAGSSGQAGNLFAAVGANLFDLDLNFLDQSPGKSESTTAPSTSSSSRNNNSRMASNPTSPASSTTTHPLRRGSAAYSLQAQTQSPSTSDELEAYQNTSPPPQRYDSLDPDAEREARLAAEEDKRRRNTAASARFRIKKKQREQALERTAKELSDRVGDLQRKVSQLEMENRWLKNLVVEKNSASSSSARAENGS